MSGEIKVASFARQTQNLAPSLLVRVCHEPLHEGLSRSVFLEGEHCCAQLWTDVGTYRANQYTELTSEEEGLFDVCWVIAM